VRKIATSLSLWTIAKWLDTYMICSEEALLMAEALVTVDQTVSNLRKELEIWQ
jgi:hypothetical protein